MAAVETTLQEEEILRSFFSQEDVPVALLAYRDLFVAQREETKQEVLDESFDERMLAMVDEQKPVKPIVITMRQRLMPLFKAAKGRSHHPHAGKRRPDSLRANGRHSSRGGDGRLQQGSQGSVRGQGRHHQDRLYWQGPAGFLDDDSVE